MLYHFAPMCATIVMYYSTTHVMLPSTGNAHVVRELETRYMTRMYHEAQEQHGVSESYERMSRLWITQNTPSLDVCVYNPVRPISRGKQHCL
jgi:hypothetical protein